MPWDKETAAAAGQKSGEARRRKAERTPEQRALDAIGSQMGVLTEELVKAAKGQGDFTDLDLKTRVAAIMRLIEWRLGRPTQQRLEPDKEEDEPGVPGPADLFSRQEGPDAGSGAGEA